MHANVFVVVVCLVGFFFWHCPTKYIYVIGRLGGPYRENCDRGLENAARGRRLRAAFSSPRSQFFPIRTDPKAANNIFIFFFFS